MAPFITTNSIGLAYVTSKHYSGMGHIYKWLGTDEQIKELWQNREALDNYLARLKELMEADIEHESDSPKQESSDDASELS